MGKSKSKVCVPWNGKFALYAGYCRQYTTVSAVDRNACFATSLPCAAEHELADNVLSELRKTLVNEDRTTSTSIIPDREIDSDIVESPD